MVDNSPSVDNPSHVDDVTDDGEEFDTLIGIIGDGIVGAVGGLAGTAALTVGLLIAASIGAFDTDSFALLTRMIGLEGYVPAVLFGYLLFLLGGMIPWPLLFASLKEYLPGKSDPVRGAFFGGAIWTGFVLAFYTGQSGLMLAAYVVLTFLAHVFYGLSLGAVFNYFMTRPDSIV
jgi:hypothetical protein